MREHGIEWIVNLSGGSPGRGCSAVEFPETERTGGEFLSPD